MNYSEGIIIGIIVGLIIGFFGFLIFMIFLTRSYFICPMMGFGWGLMFSTPLTFLVLIVLGAYYLITEFTKTSRSSSGHSERALEILKERYTKGEIIRGATMKMKEELEL
jgi:uncharacterized membrane protein